MSFIDRYPVPRGPRTAAHKARFDAWYAAYLLSADWLQKRAQILVKDSNTCVHCNCRGWIVHHKTYIRVGCELLQDLETVCDSCHKRIHGYSVLVSVPSQMIATSVQYQMVDPDEGVWFLAAAGEGHQCDHCEGQLRLREFAYFGAATLERHTPQLVAVTGVLHSNCWDGYWDFSNWFSNHQHEHDKEQKPWPQRKKNLTPINKEPSALRPRMSSP